MLSFRLLFLLSSAVTIAVSFSPHEDLLKSTVQSAKCENIQEAFRVLFMKIDLYLAACISAPNSLSSVKERETVGLLGYCGLFSSLSIKVTNETTFVLSAPEAYSIKTVFLLFDTSWSGKRCSKHGMKWVDGENKIKHFCGRRCPWREYSDGNVIRLIVYGLHVYQDSFGFDFHIFYSTCRICEMKKIQPARFTIYNPIYEEVVSAVSHTNSFWHIFCEPGDEVRVVVHYDVEEYLSVLDVYAGPGPKSTKMFPSDRPISTGNFMFLDSNISWYQNMFDTNTSHAYIVNTGRDRNMSLVFRYGITYTYQITNCEHTLPYRTDQVTPSPTRISITADGKRNVQCYFDYETNLHVEYGERSYISLEILHFEFQGPTIVSEYSDQPCHYGGIFLYAINSDHSPYSLCNGKNEYIPQILALKSNRVLGVFQWFEGYSSGSLSAILHVTYCIMNHMTPQNIFFVWPATLACQQFLFSWQNFLETIGSSYSLNITSASDILLGPSTLSYSLDNIQLMNEEISNIYQVIVRNFTTWPMTDTINEFVIKHQNENNQSEQVDINLLANIAIKLLILEVKSAWHITLKVSRSLCNGIMNTHLSSNTILITGGCTLEHVLPRNKTVIFIHAPLNRQLTYITLESDKGCEEIYVIKDEVIPARDIHRYVYTRFTNIKERVVFKHEISQSILTLALNVTSLADHNCTRVLRVTPSDLTIKQPSTAEDPDDIGKLQWTFHNKR